MKYIKKKFNYIFGNFNSIHMEKWSKYFENDENYINVSYEPIKNKKNIVNLNRNKNNLLISSFYILIFLFKKFLKSKPKKIVIHYLNEVSLIILFLKYFFNYKIIIIPWGSDLNIDHGKKIRFLKKIICKKCDLIITDGYHIKNKLINTYKIEENKIKIFNFPINFDLLDTLKNDQKINKNQIIFSNRSLDDIYSIDVLIHAFKRFSKVNHYYKLVIVGDGELKNELMLLVNKLNLSDRVIFTGKLDFTKMINKLLDAEIFISTSTTDAGLSSSIAEAIYFKKKIIVANNSDNNVWIKNYDNGLLFKTNDIESLFDKINYLSKNNLSLQGKTYLNFVHNFSYNLIMPKIKDTIDNL